MPLELLQTILRQLDRLLSFFGLQSVEIFRWRLGRNGLPRNEHNVLHTPSNMRPLLDLQKEVISLFLEPCDIHRMRYMSLCLKEEYQKKLKSSTACQERGTFIALDLGGSTLRVAVIELCTRADPNGGLSIRHMTVHKINEHVRQLFAKDFFDWMAAKAIDTLRQCEHTQSLLHETVHVGLAWSFPIEQTSHRGGTIQPMGKGFKAHEGIIGQDLGNLIELACRKRGLEVRVSAIVNDSSATLLSQAYKDPATTVGLILGTGTNAAIYLPVNLLGADKFGKRDAEWFTQAEKVIINTELSMFGKGILPVTRWDENLNRNHICPDFQPLEYMTTGRYLSEIFRLVIAEAVDTCHLFDGVLPEPLQGRYTLDTALLAAIEEDTTKGCISSAERIQKEFKLLCVPTPAEMRFLRLLTESISHRAAAYIATTIHALWMLEHDPMLEVTSKTIVAANGSVISMYPGFRDRCQQYANELVAASQSSASSRSRHEITIRPTEEATLLGVAVAVAVSGAT
ncbi:N-acetylglucosamine kinase 1 [Lithohypha guttulata]|nr:N-acetylglucosamine kinase 1 [Lithohypha guttulata]